MANDKMTTTIYSGRGPTVHTFLVVRIMGNGNRQEYLKTDGSWTTNPSNAHGYATFSEAMDRCHGDRFIADCYLNEVNYYYK